MTATLAEETKTKRELPVIAIDGPAGAGKSTLAAHLACKFGFLNLETGAMYRALALKAIDNDLGFAKATSSFWTAWMCRVEFGIWT
jgi:cytidylate kinase